MARTCRGKDHSGNADRGGKLKGHHWGLLRLIGWEQKSQRYWCWPLKMRLLSGKLNPFTPQKLSVKIYGKQVQVEAVEREVFIRGFQSQVKVVVAKGKKEPIIFLSTDLTLTAPQIMEIYAARFSIELAIRDLKQHFGLAHYQCYLGIAIDRFVHLACIAYCLFGLFQRQQLNSDWMPTASPLHSELSFSRLRRGLQHFAISRVLSPKSASEADFLPQSPELDQILRLVA